MIRSFLSDISLSETLKLLILLAIFALASHAGDLAERGWLLGA